MTRCHPFSNGYFVVIWRTPATNEPLWREGLIPRTANKNSKSNLGGNKQRNLTEQCCSFRYTLKNYISISFHSEWDTIVVTVFEPNGISIWFKNCQHDHIPFTVKGDSLIHLSAIHVRDP